MGALEGGPRVGFDLVELDRFERALVRPPGLIARLFTPAEVACCGARGKPVLHYAARFAAKEAVGKLLGSGVVSWREIEVARGAPPLVSLTGRTARLADEQGIAEIRVSLSHVGSLAGACAVAMACSSEGADDGRLLES